MDKLACHFLIIAIALLAGFGTGCGKKAGTEATTAQPSAPTAGGSVSASNLPGAQEVMAALDKNDYDGAMAALLRVRQTVTSGEQKVQFATLADEMKMRLLGAAPNQPKAAEALTALRQITGGR